MRAACFVDADNIPSPQDKAWGEALEAMLDAHCRVRQAHCVSKHLSASLTHWLYKHSFKVVDAYSPIHGKNTADIQLTLAIAEEALRAEEVMRFIIVSGDSDFAPVLRKLFEWGHELCVVSPPGQLADVADHLGASVTLITSPSSTSASADRATSATVSTRDALEALRSLLSDGEPHKLPSLAHGLNVQLGLKWYERLGYPRLIEALERFKELKVTPVDGDYMIAWRPSTTPNTSSSRASDEEVSDEAVSEERLRAFLMDILSGGEGILLTLLHTEICKAFPSFDYKALGYKKLTLYLNDRFPELSHDGVGDHPRWYWGKASISPTAPQAALTSTKPLRDQYIEALSKMKIKPLSVDAFCQISAWLSAQERFIGVGATTTRGAEELGFTKREMSTVFRAHFQMKHFEVTSREGEPSQYMLRATDHREVYASLRAYARLVIAAHEPLDESEWEALWS